MSTYSGARRDESGRPASDAEIHALWYAGILSWKLWDQQLPIYDAMRALPKYGCEIVVILCARQFGKSVLNVLMAIEDCLRHDNVYFLIVGPTLKQTRKIVEPRMKMLCRDAPPGLVRHIRSEDKWIIGTCELCLGGFDVNSTSERGQTLGGIYVEEIVDADPDKYVEAMKSDLGPALTHSDGGKMRFFTTPPKIPDHPFVLDTMVEAELSDSLYVYTIDDNIALTPEKKAAAIKRAGGEKSIEARRELWCEIIRDPTKVCVPSYDQDRHVLDFNLPLDRFLQITGDWGGVKDKSCFLLHTYDFYSDIDLIWDERVFEANTPYHVILEGILDMERTWRQDEEEIPWVIDCPGQTLIDLQNDLATYRGLKPELGERLDERALGVPPKSDWKATINRLESRFAEPRGIWIHPRCRFFQLSCRSGTFNEQKTDFARTKALGHMDGLAAGMYALRTRRTDNPRPGREAVGKNQVQVIRPGRANDSRRMEIAKALQPKRFKP